METDHRPDPDALLARLSAGEPTNGRGRLKIFMGYSAGVGKTYAMLAEARELEMKRGEVLVGYVEPHGRSDTEALLLGLDIVPYLEVEYRGIRLREFNLDETLRRRPKLVLVDELAHTNADGCRHAKRWQDVVELLDAGVSVYTTMNVQHIESLNDIVGKISGVAVRETVPDTVFDRADEIEVVDLPPEELLERFREGKIYVPEQAKRATERFFRKETLVALRELALRRAAEHVNRQVELGRRGTAMRPIWATRERLMVAVGPSPSSAKLIRAARRMATDMRCLWYAVAVERDVKNVAPGMPDPRVEANLRLAETLGAEIGVLRGDRVARALVDFAHDRGVTRLLVGKTARSPLSRLLRGDLVDDVIQRSGDIDVLVIRGDEELGARAAAAPSKRLSQTASPNRRLSDLLFAGATLSVALGLGLALRTLQISEANIVLLFVVGVAVVAYRASLATAVVAATASMLLFNFFFTEPLYTLDVHDPGHLVTFGGMLVIGFAISGLVSRVRRQAEAARSRADANEALYRISRRLSETAGARQIALDLQRLAEELLGLDAVVFLSATSRPSLDESLGSNDLVSDPRERAVALWALEHAQEAGRGTDTIRDVTGWFLPLVGREERRFGVMGVKPRSDTPIEGELRRLVRSLAAIAAQALERDALAERASRATVEAESERLRSDLLAAVSHDLRTPLASIGGAASAVLHSSTSSLADGDRELLRDVYAESERLARLVENLLQLGRLNEGKVSLNADWHPVEEMIDSALRQVSRIADTRRIRVTLPPEPILCWADEPIMTQVVTNLIDNALKYAPDGEITVIAERYDNHVRIEVRDQGPGFPPGEISTLFGRFRRGDTDAVRAAQGSGLGLAICRAAAIAHDGSIEATNAPDGGARIAILLPLPAHGSPPLADSEPPQ